VLGLGLVAVMAAYGYSLLTKVPRDPIIAVVHDFRFTNQLGQAVTADSLRGQVWVADVIFTQCPTQCRRLSAQMEKVQASLPKGARLVSLTADPEYDTPQVLARYGEKYHADPSKWLLLHGTKEGLYRTASEDLKFSVLDTGERGTNSMDGRFIHSTSYSIVDRRGQLRAVVQGENEDAPEQILKAVKRLLREY
jgi:protein SCO1/2